MARGDSGGYDCIYACRLRPVSTVEIRPSIRVAVCCDVATGGIKSHYPVAAVLGLPAAVKPPYVVGMLGVVC